MSNALSDISISVAVVAFFAWRKARLSNSNATQALRQAELWQAELREKEQLLAEREDIMNAMFAALADARLAILATVENFQKIDTTNEEEETE